MSRVGDETISVDSPEAGAELRALGTHELSVGDSACIAIRPEKIFISKNEPDSDDDTKMQGIVLDLGYLGSRSLYRIQLPSGKIIQVSAQNRRRSATRALQWDDKVWISWRPRSAVVLTA